MKQKTKTEKQTENNPKTKQVTLRLIFFYHGDICGTADGSGFSRRGKNTEFRMWSSCFHDNGNKNKNKKNKEALKQKSSCIQGQSRP